MTMGRDVILAVALVLSAGTARSADAPRPVDGLQTLVCQQAVRAVQAEAERSSVRAAVRCGSAAAGGLKALALQTLPSEAELEVEVLQLPPLRSGNAAVTMRLRGGGGRAVQLAWPVQLQISVPAWVANRHIAKGQRVVAQDLQLQEVVWPTGGTPQPAPAQAPEGLAKQDLEAGHTVLANMVKGREEVQRGDTVMVWVQEGSIALQTAATVVAAASVGSPVRVQLRGRQETVSGWLVDAQTVSLNARGLP